MSTTTRPAVGDIVTPQPDMATARDRARNFRVIKVNPKTTDAEPLDGKGRPVRAPHEYWMPAPDPIGDEGVPADATTGVLGVPYEAPLSLGQTVRFKGLAPKHYPADQVYVVLADGANGYRLAPLGGDDSRYYRSIARSRLVPVRVEVASVTEV